MTFRSRSLVFFNGKPHHTLTVTPTGTTYTHKLEDIRKSGVKRLAKALVAHRGLNWRSPETRKAHKKIAREILALYPQLAGNHERRF